MNHPEPQPNNPMGKEGHPCHRASSLLPSPVGPPEPRHPKWRSTGPSLSAADEAFALSPEAGALPGCSSPGPTCLPRRDFLKLSSAALGGFALSRLPAIAGPFTRADFDKLVPADKKLKPDWLKSLFERGSRTVYRGSELEKIGMPVGGIGCGQVYLGGDGRLWHWDIFNQHIGTGAEHYAKPLTPKSPFDQGFELRVLHGGSAQTRALDRTGWRDITFTGEYPIGLVEYRDAEAPVSVSLEAFSPFIPLNVEDSSLPATVLRFTVKNLTTDPVQVELLGRMENAVCLHSGQSGAGARRNRIVERADFTFLECSAEDAPKAAARTARPDLPFEDFEKDSYEGWTTTGTAFGNGPVPGAKIPAYQGDVGLHGQRTVNSHATAPGADVGARDAAVGTLTSKPFVIERDYLTFLIGGGAHAGRTCLNLLVDGKVVLSATGQNNNRMQPHSFDVRPWAGQPATLQIVDAETGGWGNIGVDDIVFSDTPRGPSLVLTEQADFGTMGLGLLRDEAGSAGETTSPDVAITAIPDGGLPPGFLAKAPLATGSSLPRTSPPPATAPLPGRVTGVVGRNRVLAAGATMTATYVVAWHFPKLKMDRLPPGRHYGTRFGSALAVVEDLVGRLPSLREQTHRWHDTWYDSTLPYWFLDRTFLNISILATSTAFRFANGRFWGWEGVGCCHGTCGHVWQYAQAMARLFPELERETRERVDFGLALQPDGAIHFRAEFNDIPAIDAQAGTILRALREHQMTTDDTWLKRNWPGIRRAVEWLIAKDGDGDGLIVGNQHNTLDTDWFGPVAWLSGLYLAALRAGEDMARIVGDDAFARRCHEIFDRGQPKLVRELFDGEYFINKPDPQHLDAINSGTGCHIDQVFGQSWAWQIGLGRVLPEKETRAALKSLWRYNFTPDVGPYREAYKAGRWYAMPGEGGLLMCSFPRADWDYAQAKGKGADWAAGYFNECMNGFEYQAAWHMIAEGLVQEGLAVTRMIHDRYHPLRRNPWNEVECGDHYARSMASYGVFLAACGYEYDGPRGWLAFAPRLTPENFRAAFTTAEGWGSLHLKSKPPSAECGIAVRWGQLRLKMLALTLPTDLAPRRVTATVAGVTIPAALARRDGRWIVQFASELTVAAGQTLQVRFS